MAKYNSGMTLGKIMDDPDMRAVVLKHMPQIESDSRYQMGRSYSLDEIKYEVESSLRDIVDKIINDLKAL